MRVLTLLSGVPAVGKSTFVRENNLEDYTISADTLRKQFRTITYNYSEDLGEVIPVIDNNKSHEIFKFILKLLKERMELGTFIVLDGKNLDKKFQKECLNLARKFKYRVNMVDIQGDMPLETILEQNSKRIGTTGYVPESVIIKNFNTRLKILKNSKLNVGGINLIPKEEFKNSLIWSSVDLNTYKKVNIIGDIHGCFDVLNEAIPEILEDEYYIFLGDYFDRGIQNKEVLTYLLNIKNKKNVVLLWGNHENHVHKFVNNNKEFNFSIAPNFLKNTIPDLFNKGTYSIDNLKDLMSSIQTVFAFSYNNKEYFVNHGGIVPEMLNIVEKGKYKIIPVMDNDLIFGFGGYSFDVDSYFNKKIKELNLDYDLIQVHGHRNSFKNYEVSNSISLEDSVEFGNNLAILEITKDSVEYKKFKNNTFNKELLNNSELNFDIDKLTNKEIMEQLNKSKFIKKSKFKNYVAYNFSRDAFKKSIWNSFTLTSRGLILEKETGNIHARGYNKFFNLNENAETNLETLEKKLAFPIKYSTKENGFLGILSASTDKLNFYSKSGETNYSKLFSKLFYTKLKENIVSSNINSVLDSLINIINKNNVSVVFEVIDIENDKHIVEYEQSKLVVLDVIENEYKLTFKDDLKKEISELLNLETPKEGFIETFNELKEFIAIHDLDTNSEGFVFKDQNNYMFKLKNKEYSFVKHIRQILFMLIEKNITKKEDLEKVKEKYLTDNYQILEKIFDENFIKNDSFDMYELRTFLKTHNFI